MINPRLAGMHPNAALQILARQAERRSPKLPTQPPRVVQESAGQLQRMLTTAVGKELNTLTGMREKIYV